MGESFLPSAGLPESSGAGAVASAVAGSEAGLDSAGAAPSFGDLAGTIGASSFTAAGDCAATGAGALLFSSDMVPSGDDEVMGM